MDSSAAVLPRRGGLPGFRASFRDVVWPWLGVRVAFVALALFAWLQGATPGPCNFELARDGWTTFPPLADHGALLPLVGVWQHWDACWYTKIATYGYESGVSSSAFFPALPMLEAGLGPLLGGQPAVAGMLVSAVASFVALVGVQQLVAGDFGAIVAARTVRYLSFAPAAFYLFAPFTEALFLAAAVWCLLMARRRAWLATAALAALAAATRLQGVLLVLPIAWEAARAARGHLPPLRIDVRRLATSARVAIALVAPVAVLVVFAAYTAVVSGSTPFDAQDTWGGRNLHWPWDVLAASWSFVETGSQLRGIQALNLATLVGVGGLGLAGLRLLPATYSLYLWPQVLLIASRIQPAPLTSTMRYAVVLFPAFVVLALLGRNRRFDTAWTVLSLTLLGALTFEFLRGDFVA